jgi:hypothetical protein
MLSEFLDRYGWAYTYAAPGSWRTGWNARGEEFILQVHLGDHFIEFEISLLPLQWCKHTDDSALLRWLLQLNLDTKLVRLGLNKRNELLLRLDILNMSVSFDHIHHIIGILAYYTEGLRDLLHQALRIQGGYGEDAQKFN